MAVLGFTNSLGTDAIGLAGRPLFLRVLALATVIFSLLATRSQAETPSAEYRLKAAFLFNFAQFTEWPPQAFANTKAPIVIGILGVDPFGSFLDETVRNEEAHGRPLVVKRFKTAAEVETCHILYISASEEPRVDSILETLYGRPVLTVGDFESFALRGGMVRFYTQNNRIRMRINLDSVRAAKLDITSRILRVAEIVSAAGK
jgi:hypothetical protein